MPKSKRKQPKVLLFIFSLSGGAGQVMLRLANSFAAHQVEVILTFGRADESLRDQVRGEVTVVSFHKRSLLSRVRQLAQLLRQQRPTVMLSTLPANNLVALAAQFIARTSTPVYCREGNNLEEKSRNWPRLKRRILLKTIPLLYRRAQKVIPNSSGACDSFRGLFPQLAHKLVTLPNPTVNPDMLERANEPLNHQFFGEDVPVILGVGRLVPEKDFSTLIRSFAIVRRNTEARLIILGEGPKRQILESLVDELGLGMDVELPGFVENPYCWLRQADLFVLSSRTEGLPNALIEALALGTPVVASDCPSGPREILEGGQLGCLVKVGDELELASAIIARLARGGRVKSEVIQRIRNKYWADSVAKSYLEVMNCRIGQR